MRNQYKVLQEAYTQVKEAHWGPNAAFLEQLKDSLSKEVDYLNKNGFEPYFVDPETGSMRLYPRLPVTDLFRQLGIAFMHGFYRVRKAVAAYGNNRITVALDSPQFQNLLKNKSEENLKSVLSTIVHELIHHAQSKNMSQKHLDYKALGRGDIGQGIDYINQKEELSTRAWQAVHWVVDNPKFANDFEGAKRHIINRLNNPTPGESLDNLYKTLTPDNKKYFIKTVYYYLNNWDKLKNAQSI